MTVINPLANALVTIYNNEVRRNKQAIIMPSSKLIINVLRVMQKEGYIGEFEYIDDGRWGKVVVQLLGRINKCGPITPRYSLKYRDMINLPQHIRTYLPSKEIGVILVSTSKGVMTHKEAARQRLGGVALGYVYWWVIKMLQVLVKESLKIPDNVSLTLENGKIKVKGPKGEVEKDISHMRGIEVRLENGELIVEATFANKRTKSLVYTLLRHVQNMITGVTKGYRYYLKIIFTHFPMSVKVVGNEVQITNLIGEKNIRRAKILPGVKVTVKGEDIIVEGIDLEKVAQTAANIERASKISGFDRRVFGDGIYIYKKEVIE